MMAFSNLQLYWLVLVGINSLALLTNNYLINHDEARIVKLNEKIQSDKIDKLYGK